jgi:YD repeat-containing protein
MNRKQIGLACRALIISAALTVGNLNAQTLVLTGDDGKSLYEVDVTTGNAQLKGAGNTNNSAWGGTLNSSGKFVLGIDNGQNLGELDRTTGLEILTAGNLFFNNTAFLFAMEIDTRTGKLYAGDFGTDKFFTIDPTTGNATFIGNSGVTATGNQFFNDLAFAPDGTLWASVGTGAANLYTINLQTGSATLAVTAQGINNLVTIAFDQNGVLYGMTYNGASNLITINTTTGATTQVGNTGINLPWGGDIAINLAPLYTPNSLPTISNIPDQTIFGGGIVGPLPFTISDSQTNTELLSVTASSSDQTTISNGDLLISGSGANRSLLIANVGKGRNRVDITISVRDESGGVGTRTFAVTNFAGQSVIVDNQDAEFTSTGVWNESATTDEFRGSSLFSSGGGGKATFTPTGLMQGDYQVFAWWSASLQDGRTTPRSSQVHYEVNHGLTQNTVLIDQRSQSGQWVSLGTYPFDGLGGESVAVSIPSSASSLSVSADAIAFVASNTTVSETDRIVDNNGPGFSTTGTWDESGTSGEFADSSLASFLPNSTASWTPTISQPGSYEVYIWIGRQTLSGGTIRRAPSVEYRVSHGDRISSVNIDQNTLESGNWTLIGTFPFSATGDENVTLISNSAGYGTGSAVADAVWFSLQDQANGLDIVYDNADSSFSTVGNWSESGALDEFNGSSVFSMSANSVAMWSFGTIEAGRYQLFVWNSGALTNGRSIVRNNAARYVIASADGPSLITIDQNLRTGDWLAIGDVNLTGDGTEGISVFAGGASTSADAVRLVKLN